MNTHFTYFWVDLLSFIFPFLFSFHPAFKFYQHWRAILLSLIVPALFFITWDVIYTQLNVWWFNPEYTLQPRFINLPFEELFFFICIPYACLFTFYCVKLYFGSALANCLNTKYVVGFVVLLLVVALFYLNRIYTSVTFIFLAAFITFLLIKKVKYLGIFFVSFILILPFFFVTNGILTGSFIEQAVVNYNPNYHIGFRIFTIPVEDVFYGALLLLMNVSIFEFRMQKHSIYISN
ncbi:MAG: lycopene cyclase domain-containing protein [Bacteroidia bacterium]|nr:lycopene cyclase domain-containing protein [Bacteroidia bacterium]